MARNIHESRPGDRRADPDDTPLLLAAEAAVLEGRLAVLREVIDDVDARIHAVSEKIRQLPAAGDHKAPPAGEGNVTGLAPSPARRP